MNTVPPKGKHRRRVTIDDVAFYYSRNCKVLPKVHQFYVEELTQLELQGKVCFTPAAILERYHANLKKRIVESTRKHAQNRR